MKQPPLWLALAIVAGSGALAIVAPDLCGSLAFLIVVAMGLKWWIEKGKPR